MVYHCIMLCNRLIIFLVVFNRISPSQDRHISLTHYISSSFRFFFLGEYYIGLSDLQRTGTYKWADGTNVSFTNWNTGFPNGGGGVVMKMSIGNSDNGKWLTRNEDDALRFICECPDGSCA